MNSRVNADNMLDSLKEMKIPLLIFSAGMGDVIVEALKLYKLYYENIKVISNFFKYDNEVMCERQIMLQIMINECIVKNRITS